MDKDKMCKRQINGKGNYFIKIKIDGVQKWIDIMANKGNKT